MHHLAFMLQVVVGRPRVVERDLCGFAYCKEVLVNCVESCVCALSAACTCMRNSQKPVTLWLLQAESASIGETAAARSKRCMSIRYAQLAPKHLRSRLCLYVHVCQLKATCFARR